MRQLTKREFTIILLGVVSFLLAYSFDQYYIYRRQLYFLSKPIQIINQLFSGTNSQ